MSRTLRQIAPMILLFGLFLPFGCSSRAPVQVPADPRQPDLPAGVEVIHVVEAGQTLWRIARAYGVELNLLIDINRIEDPTDVAIGTRLRIPGAERVLHVEPAPVSLTVPEATEDGERALFLRPLKGATISYFGAPRGGRSHKGVDLKGFGGEPIQAARKGTVAFSGSMRGYGNVVILEHADGWSTLYAHNRTNLVRSGEYVKEGQTIARVGRTGNASTEHCHFELRRRNRAIDPLPWFLSES